MKERPILFSAEMVRAILEGRKTQTRRVVKPKWIPLVEEVVKINGRWVFTTLAYDLTTPYGEPGDRLWVRESFNHFFAGEHHSSCLFLASAGRPELRQGISELYAKRTWPGWKSPIHMPRWASRITLEITDVRVERLNDISEEAAIAEGCFDEKEHDGSLPSQIYMQLWDSLNEARGYGWDTNPWVWVIEFRRVKP